MRTFHSAMLAAVGLLALSGTAAADIGQFRFGVVIGPPVQAYVARPAPRIHSSPHYSPPGHAAPHAYPPAAAHDGTHYLERHVAQDAHYARDAQRASRRHGDHR